MASMCHDGKARLRDLVSSTVLEDKRWREGMAWLKSQGRTLRVLFGAKDIRRRFGDYFPLRVHMHEDAIPAEL